MHSSAISLLFRAQERGGKAAAIPAADAGDSSAGAGSNYLINLVDSPVFYINVFLIQGNSTIISYFSFD